MAHDSNGHIFVDSTSAVRRDQDIIAVVGGLSGTKYRPFTHGNVNKWSKHKPVKFASLDRLTEEEFKGERNETERGYWYGVKIANSGSGSGQKLVPSVHTDITLEYLRPIGLMPSEPHRVLDFDGYYHNAVPSPLARYEWGDQDLIGYVDTEQGLGVSLNYGYGLPNAGIDVAALVAESPSSVYLACVVSKGDAHYAAYLRNTDVTGHPVTPLYYQNAWRRNFFVDFRRMLGIPTRGREGGWTISLILCAHTSAPQHIDESGEWTEIPEDTGLSNVPYACPFNTSLELEGIGRSLWLDRVTIDPPALSLSQLHQISDSGVNITCTYDRVDTTRTGYYKVVMRYGLAGEEVEFKGTFNPAATSVVDRSISLTAVWSQFGLVERPSSGTIYVTMRTGWSEDVYITSNSGSFSVNN